jgi:hypothetical protein
MRTARIPIYGLTPFLFVATTERRGSSRAGPRIEWIYRDSCAAKEFPALEKLFDIPGPGKYTLRLEFQVFEQKHKGTNYLYDLTILPPVNVPVIKPKQEGKEEGAARGP